MRSIPSFCMPVLLALFALSGVGVSIHIPSAAAAPTVTATISIGGHVTGVGVNSSRTVSMWQIMRGVRLL